MLCVILTGRDFGGLLHAERARCAEFDAAAARTARRGKRGAGGSGGDGHGGAALLADVADAGVDGGAEITSMNFLQ